MLEIRNVHKTFNLGTINEKHALNGVDLTLDEGDFVTVIGGNGAGKSTMLNAIAGSWPVDEGSILIDGVDVTGLPEFKRATFLGRVFQDPMTGTTATMQIDENLALAARPWSETWSWLGYLQEGEDSVPRAVKDSRSWSRGSYDLKGRSVVRWTASGSHSADGILKEAEGSASGRTHRCIGSKDSGKGARPHR